MFRKLKSINIELASSCNLKCKMCYRNSMTYEMGIMPKELFIDIVEKIKNSNYNIETIYLHWRGEPCISPYIDDAIRILKSELNTLVVLFTNGTLLTPELSDKLLTYNIDEINFSLDANSEVIYNEIRGKKLYKTVKNNIINCVNRRNELKSSTKINIYSVLMKENMNELLSLNNEWSEIVDNLHIKYDMRNSSDINVKSSETCFWPYSNIIIGWDGNVSACCMDVNIDYYIGSIKDYSIGEIFESKELNDLCKSIQDKNPINRLCEKCTFFNCSI